MDGSPLRLLVVLQYSKSTWSPIRPAVPPTPVRILLSDSWNTMEEL